MFSVLLLYQRFGAISTGHLDLVKATHGLGKLIVEALAK
jgi:hypothetical protein